MACITPIKIKNPNPTDFNDMRINVPCGKCPNCIKRRVYQWVFRLKQEQIVADSSAFLTLTYDDNHLPRAPDGMPILHKPDYQKFIKLLRMRMKRDKNLTPNLKALKYYLVGEYGAKTKRPHYHAIMFNIPYEYLNNLVLQEMWSKGYVDVGTVSDGSIAYVAGYCEKKLYMQRDFKRKEFTACSKGLGVDWVSPNRKKFFKEVLEPYFYSPGGQKMPFPRYYKEKIFNEDEKAILAEKAKQFQDQKEPQTKKQQFDFIENEFIQFKRKQLTKANLL